VGSSRALPDWESLTSHHPRASLSQGTVPLSVCERMRYHDRIASSVISPAHRIAKKVMPPLREAHVADVPWQAIDSHPEVREMQRSNGLRCPLTSGLRRSLAPKDAEEKFAPQTAVEPIRACKHATARS
jgi:hypothetical protein